MLITSLLGLGLGLGLGLTGCAGGQAGYPNVPVSGGSEGRVGDITVTDAMFDYQGPIEAGMVYRPDDTVDLKVTIVNGGDTPDRLVSVSSPIAGGGIIKSAQGGATDGAAMILGHHTLAAGDTKPVAAITVPDTTFIDLRLTGLKSEIRAGLTYPVVFTFARAGQLRLQLRVDNPDEPREPCALPPNGRPPQVFTAPLGQAPAPPSPAPPGCSSIYDKRPRLTDLSARVDGEFDEVVLRFEPGSEVPLTRIEEVDDGKVRVAGSNDEVQLAGKQALRVSVSPALLGGVKALRTGLPSVAEVRVLGSSQGETVLGIGISGEGDLAPQVDNSRTRTVIRIKHPPFPPAAKRECGSVILTPESEASGIATTGTSCDDARDVAERAAGHISEPYDTPTEYSCRIQDRDEGPARLVDYTCRRADAQITFTVS